MLGRKKLAFDQDGWTAGLALFNQKAGHPTVLVISDRHQLALAAQMVGSLMTVVAPLIEHDMWVLANDGNSIVFDLDGPEEFKQLDAPHGAENADEVTAAIAEHDAEAARPPRHDPVTADAATGSGAGDQAPPKPSTETPPGGGSPQGTASGETPPA